MPRGRPAARLGVLSALAGPRCKRAAEPLNDPHSAWAPGLGRIGALALELLEGTSAARSHRAEILQAAADAPSGVKEADKQSRLLSQEVGQSSVA